MIPLLLLEQIRMTYSIEVEACSSELSQSSLSGGAYLLIDWNTRLKHISKFCFVLSPAGSLHRFQVFQSVFSPLFRTQTPSRISHNGAKAI